MSAAQKLDNNPLFDKKLVNAFVEGVKKTLETIAQTPVQVGKPFIEMNKPIHGDVAGIVGMVAPPMKGNLVLGFPKEAVFTIMENMLGEKYTEVNDSVADAVGELTNMVYGVAKTSLNELGYKFEMAIPTVIRGDFQLANSSQGPSLVIPFTTSKNDPFFIHLTVG